jgi:hypothetical protein
MSTQSPLPDARCADSIVRKSWKIRPRPHFCPALVRRLAFASADGMAFANLRHREVASMGRAFILWLLGVPASVLVVLWLIGFFH